MKQCKKLDELSTTTLPSFSKISSKYRIVTLDGEVINVRGSMTGGSLITSRSILLEKEEEIVKIVEERLNDLNNIKDDSHPDYISRRNKMDEFTIRSEIDFFAPVDYIFDYLLQDFDIVVNGVISQFNSNDIDEKKLRECIKECLK